MKKNEQITVSTLIQALPHNTKHALLKNLPLISETLLQERIFVNRNLRMEKILYVGFDLDWTIATYNRIPLEQLTFRMVIDRLVQRYGYPREILTAEFRPDFSHRGLLIDKLKGTVLKMDRHRYVGRAYMGRLEVETAERTKLYRRERIDLMRERFYHVNTLFELPEVNIFSEIVDIKRRNPQKIPIHYEQIFIDIRQAIDSIHSDSTLKSQIISELETFLPHDPAITLTLQKMALRGRKLMLITNSELYYTDAICSYLFDKTSLGLDSWRDLFDLVVVSAEKPLFFKKNRPFVELDESGHETGTTLVPEWKKIYRTGSRDGLMSLLGSLGEHVLYIGDHIYGDIRWPRMSSTWRTALIIRELEEELLHQKNLSVETNHLQFLRLELVALGQKLDNLREAADLVTEDLLGSRGEVSELRIILHRELEEISTQHSALRNRTSELQERISSQFNPTWGSLFKQGSSKSLFANQVEDFACLYTSSLKNFLRYGSTHYFRVPLDPMAHELEI